ncbi:Cp22.4.1 protein [Cryptosporidium bovis]|uniref:Cp22.4.1 protein n=1 Tax=Cryptosporidium bovis TaxID=310047 RepID=UPI00351A19C4|nr:Cp22.4.1 protein [Cryptosporidium bovis]
MGKDKKLIETKKNELTIQEPKTKNENEVKSRSRSSKSKSKNRIKHGCWSKCEIQESIDKLENKLNDKEKKLSKSKRRRILLRLSKLRRGLKGEIEIGGQIQKSIKTIKREMKLKNVNSSILLRKNSNVVCLCCRKKGHQMVDCRYYKPLNKNLGDENAKHTCFLCGEKGHTLKDCKKPREDNSVLPFASCFKCGESGHIVAYCPNNESGSIYPKGGSCNICGSVRHLSKNCDQNKMHSKKYKTINSGSSNSKDLNDTSNSNENIDDPDLMWKNIIG